MKKKSENLELFEILKDKDVKGKNLLIKVCNIEEDAEGWISAEQFTRLIGEAVEEAFKELLKDYLKKLKNEIKNI